MVLVIYHEIDQIECLIQEVQKLLIDDLAYVVSLLKPVEFATLVTAYLEYLDQSKRQEYWNRILKMLNSIDMNHRGLEVLQAMLVSSGTGTFKEMKAVKSESNSAMMTLMTKFQQGENALVSTVIEGLLRHHGVFSFNRQFQL